MNRQTTANLQNAVSIPLLHVRIDDSKEETYTNGKIFVTVENEKKIENPKIQKIMLERKIGLTCYVLKKMSHTITETKIKYSFTLDGESVSCPDIPLDDWMLHVKDKDKNKDRCSIRMVSIDAFRNYMAGLTSTSFEDDIHMEDPYEDPYEEHNKKDKYIYFAFEQGEKNDTINPMVRIGCTVDNVVNIFERLNAVNPRIDMSKKYYYCKCVDVELFGRYIHILYSEKSVAPHRGWFSNFSESEVGQLFTLCMKNFQ
jgi:hypothetical protein